MGKELAMAEVLKVPPERKGEDENELSLELSIGGNYVKRLEGKTKEENDSRSDISENGHGFVDLRKKKEIQALRRQEARMKREEKLKKSRVLHLVEDKQILEAQKFQARVQDRESREKEGILGDSFRRKEKNGTNEAVQDLNISLFTQNKTQCLFPKELYLQTGNGFGYPSVVEEEKNGRNEENVSDSMAHWSRNGNGSWNSSMDCESLERSSPAASDYQSTSQKGGSSSDTGSHSSSMRVHQNQHASRNDKMERQEVNNSSSKSKPERCTNVVLSSSTQRLQSTRSVTTQIPEAETHPNQTNNICSNIKSGVVNKLPKPPNYSGAPTQHMPRVSTTGNGPNGKTITGFLYKYTNNEVSILCSCHGSSFSPAQFVEHAGGVDVSQPLRHITMVPPFLKS